MRQSIPNRQKTQLRIDKILFEKTKIIAEAENRYLNSQIEYFIKKGIEAYERDNGSISV